MEVEASGFDPDGCNPDGCVAENTRDNDRGASSRWSCRGTLVDGDAGCRITYDFDDPQDIHSLRIAFYEGTEGTLTLNVRVNGNLFDTITSSGTTDVYQTFVLGTEDTTSISLNHDDFANRPHEWVSLTEVSPRSFALFTSLCLVHWAHVT